MRHPKLHNLFMYGFSRFIDSLENYFLIKYLFLCIFLCSTIFWNINLLFYHFFSLYFIRIFWNNFIGFMSLVCFIKSIQAIIIIWLKLLKYIKGSHKDINKLLKLFKFSIENHIIFWEKRFYRILNHNIKVNNCLWHNF